MQEAKVQGKLLLAGQDAPNTGIRPEYGAEVQKRYVTRTYGRVNYFYRNRRGQGKGCPRRY